MMNKSVKTTIENLEKNNMQVIYVEKVADIANEVLKLIKKGDSVAVGGSVSLKQSGVDAILRNGDYNFFDRYKDGLSKDEIKEVFRKSFTADTFFCSANAITENGELVNVDGNSNRVAALLFGPESVVVIAGVNKIVKTAEDGLLRVKNTAAPLNAKRLNCDTYCAVKGECVSFKNGNADRLCTGCNSLGRICCNYVVSAYQREKNRIKIILCEENLGY